MSLGAAPNETEDATMFGPTSRLKNGWRELCPWFMIFRALPIACSPTIIIFALIASVLSPVGFLVSERIFIGEEFRKQGGTSFEEFQTNRSTYRAVFPDQAVEDSSIMMPGFQLNGLDLVFYQHVKPATQLLRIDAGWQRFCYYGIGWFWSILVWTFFGTCICRVAVMRMARNESIALDDAFEYAVWKFTASFSGIVLPIMGVLLLLIPLAILGLLIKLDIGIVLVGAIWIVALFFGLLMGLLLFGLLFSWPLIIPSVSCEGQDSFDAVSRTFAYTYRRPIHYLLYLLIALVFGGIVWFVTSQFTNGVIHMTYWGTSFGANIGMDMIGATSVGEEVPDASGSRLLGENLIRFWNGFAKTVAAAFIHGFFWCVASAVYLLLRKDMDRIDYDEVILVDPFDADELPELEIDKDGIPSIKSGSEAVSATKTTNDASDQDE